MDAFLAAARRDYNCGDGEFSLSCAEGRDILICFV
jgi:hypothetical protein